MLPPEKQLIPARSSVCSPAWQYTPGAVGHRLLNAPLLWPQRHSTIPLCLHSLLISGCLKAPGFPAVSYSGPAGRNPLRDIPELSPVSTVELSAQPNRIYPDHLLHNPLRDTRGRECCPWSWAAPELLRNSPSTGEGTKVSPHTKALQPRCSPGISAHRQGRQKTLATNTGIFSLPSRFDKLLFKFCLIVVKHICSLKAHQSTIRHTWKCILSRR